MRPEFVSLILLGVSVALLILIAIVVPWTRAAVILWLVTAPSWVATTVLVSHAPVALRVAVALLVIVWAVILFFPDRSPIGPLSRAERACQKVISGVSAGARAAFEAQTLPDQTAGFIAELEGLEPPNDLWRTVKTAQLLDLRADPPQVGIGDATDRLVTWPWQDALDHRILRVRLRLDDALRARVLRHIPRPGFDDMTSSMRYAFLFIGNLWRRFEDLQAREGGLKANYDEAAALAALGASVRPPNTRWGKARDLTVEIMGLELKAATAGLDAPEQERLLTARNDFGQTLADLSARDLVAAPEAADDTASTTRT